MTLMEYEAYFKNEIAAKKIIGHSDKKMRFVMLDDDEFSNVPNGLDLNSFCLILHKYETLLTANDSAKYIDRKTCGFSILKKLGKGQSATPAKIIQSEAEIIAKKIWAKMLKDRRNGAFFLTDFDTQNFKIQFLKGVFDNSAGVTVELEISPKINPYCGIYTANDWVIQNDNNDNTIGNL